MAEEKKDQELSLEDAGELQETEEKKEPESWESTAYCCAQALITAVVGVVVLFTFFIRLIGVSGGSMQDTLYTGDRLLVLNSIFCDFQPGDVVVVNDYNAGLNETLVKRRRWTSTLTPALSMWTGRPWTSPTPRNPPIRARAPSSP